MQPSAYYSATFVDISNYNMNLAFETLSIEVINSWFPPLPTGVTSSTKQDNISWNYSYNLESGLYIEELDFDLVGITITISLVEENIYEPDPICSLQLKTMFKVTGSLPVEYKLHILQVFLGICVGQAQGIYVAKNENNYLAKTMPPMFDTSSREDELLTLIETEW